MQIFKFFIYSVYVCVYTHKSQPICQGQRTTFPCVHTHTNHSSPSRSEISSLLLPSIFWRSNLTCQAWQLSTFIHHAILLPPVGNVFVFPITRLQGTKKSVRCSLYTRDHALPSHPRPCVLRKSLPSSMDVRFLTDQSFLGGGAFLTA